MNDNFEIEIRHYGKTYIIKRPNTDVSYDDVYADVKAILRAAGFEGLVKEIEALEEVEERIEIIQLQCTDAKYVTEQILNDRVNLCEKALNGELLDIDSLDDGEFRNFKKRSGDYTHIYNSDLIAYLKQYLNEKK